MSTIHIHRFVDIHNNHPICKQAKRDHYLPTAKPFEMYFYPESEIDYTRSADNHVLQELELEVAQYNLDDYLLLETILLFQSLLSSGGFPMAFSYQDEHEQAYLFLRQEVWKFVTGGNEINVYNQPRGADELVEQDRLEQEILKHADIEYGDYKLNIGITDEEDFGDMEKDNVDEETANYESGDDDQLVLDIKGSNYFC